MNDPKIVEKKVSKGGNNQSMVYLPKKYISPGEEVVIIKKSDILSKKIVIELKRDDKNEIPS